MRLEVSRDDIEQAFAALRNNPSYEGHSKRFESGEMPTEMFQALALRPELLLLLASAGESFYPGGLIERMLKERVILDISRANSCQYCVGSHTVTMRGLGIADPVASLDQPEELTEREQVAIEYSRAAMRDSNRVPDELFDRLKKVFSKPEIVELTFLIGFMQNLNLFNNCLQVTYRGEYG